MVVAQFLAPRAATAYMLARIWQKIEVTKADAAVKVEQARAEAKIALAAVQAPTSPSA